MGMWVFKGDPLKPIDFPTAVSVYQLSSGAV